ncbi:MAG TPA: hypothetical protein VF317_02660 [Dermatophilaceae bacterium]
MFCPEEFTQRLKQPEDRAQVVLNELITDGRVVLSPDIDGDARYELATDGHALAGATARQPVTRDTAQRALDGFLARVEEINANPMAGWGVRKLVLFGSFLDPNIERVGDVDLAVEMVPPHQLTKEQFDAVMRRWIHGRRQVQPGEPMLQFEVMPFLKSRNRS